MGHSDTTATTSERNNTDLVRVMVPKGCRPGQTILVQHPTMKGRAVSAVIPKGHHPGSCFHVSFAPVVSAVPHDKPNTSSIKTASSSDELVSGLLKPTNYKHEVSAPSVLHQNHEPKTYKRCSEEMLLLHNKGLVKIKVPPNLKPGDKMRVQIPDGRLIHVIIPQGNVSEFHVKVPAKKQNFHDNPIAVHAPMALGPLFM